MNVNLGAPYEAIIKKFIDLGYAGNRTEVIRQALSSYDREMEEAVLVRRGIEAEMALIRAGKSKTHSLKKVLKEAGLD